MNKAKAFLCRKTSPQWIFEADIKACFDNIRHDWILKNIPVNKTILNQWLKTGYIEKKRLFPNREGYATGWNHIADVHEHGLGWIGKGHQQRVPAMEE